ncbi:MAG: hypothetical protein M3404_01195, partial [Actinomycetota bacterium]|nr:hypothetical protein [Actinomycetota bacterium]
MSDRSAPSSLFGPNDWLVEEMYEQYRGDPSSVSEGWQEFFADYRKEDNGAAADAPPQTAPSDARKSAPAP